MSSDVIFFNSYPFQEELENTIFFLTKMISCMVTSWKKHWKILTKAEDEAQYFLMFHLIPAYASIDLLRLISYNLQDLLLISHLSCFLSVLFFNLYKILSQVLMLNWKHYKKIFLLLHIHTPFSNVPKILHIDCNF